MNEPITLKDGTSIRIGCRVTTIAVSDDMLTPGSSSRGQVVEIQEQEPRICFQYGIYCDECWIETKSCSNATPDSYPVLIRHKDCFF